MIEPIALIAFWISLACIALSYIGYPVLLAAWPYRRRHDVGDELPRVSLMISAFNESGVIAQKIENSLAIDYPTDKLEIVVISDESEDGTDEIVSQFRDRGVLLFRQAPRRGKSLGLTRFVPETSGVVLVFSDANSMYTPQAVRKLVRHFSDPRVGYVVGSQRYKECSRAVSVAESFYWQYETWIKQQESRIGSVVGGDGAMYAIRRELFRPLRDDDISDFTLPLQIVARRYRGVYDPEAVCEEETAANFRGEFRRKARIVNRSLRAVLRVPQTLNPLRVGFFACQLFVHKVLRWHVPFFLAAMLVASGILAENGLALYQVCFCVQLGFYLLAAMGSIPGIKRFKPVYFAYYFCLVNVAAAVGVISMLCGRRFATWNPSRAASEQSFGAVQN